MASTRNRYCNEHNVFGFKITMKIETSTQYGIYDCIPLLQNLFIAISVDECT